MTGRDVASSLEQAADLVAAGVLDPEHLSVMLVAEGHCPTCHEPLVPGRDPGYGWCTGCAWGWSVYRLPGGSPVVDWTTCWPPPRKPSSSSNGGRCASPRWSPNDRDVP